MSAIGGVVDFRNNNIDFSSFNAIRNAQILRGRRSSVAYIDSGVGMFYNSDGIFDCEQPIISERKGYNVSLVIDSPFFDATSAIEAYRAYGVEFVGMLDIPFAIALYDGERRMLLLARDKKGKKPLYYSFSAGKVFFSSEAKGVLATQKGSIKINSEILSSHLTSPMGIYGAADIYRDVFELRRGECILFSELGMSNFFYRTSNSRKISLRSGNKLKGRAIEPRFDVDEGDIFSSLDDALVAFDIPQFDVHLPSVCQIFSNIDNINKSKKTDKRDKNENSTVFQFTDYIKRYNIFYSYEREDRLSAFYGKMGVGIIARFDENEKVIDIYENNKKKMLKALTEAFFLIDRNEMLFLREVFGDAKFNYLLESFDNEKIKKENTEQLVRILGMLYQAVKWSKLRELELVNV